MKLTMFAILASLTLGASAAPTCIDRTTEQPSATVAFEVPGTENRGSAPVLPENTVRDDSTWDDTADTSDDLNAEAEALDEADSKDVHLDSDLNNDVHDPLLENPDDLSDAPSTPSHEADPTDPMVDPLP